MEVRRCLAEVWYRGQTRGTVVIRPDLMPYSHCPHLALITPPGRQQGEDKLLKETSPSSAVAPQTGRVGGNNCNQSGPLWNRWWCSCDWDFLRCTVVEQGQYRDVLYFKNTWNHSHYSHLKVAQQRTESTVQESASFLWKPFQITQQHTGESVSKLRYQLVKCYLMWELLIITRLHYQCLSGHWFCLTPKTLMFWCSSRGVMRPNER